MRGRMIVYSCDGQNSHWCVHAYVRGGWRLKSWVGGCNLHLSQVHKGFDRFSGGRGGRGNFSVCTNCSWTHTGGSPQLHIRPGNSSVLITYPGLCSESWVFQLGSLSGWTHPSVKIAVVIVVITPVFNKPSGVHDPVRIWVWLYDLCRLSHGSRWKSIHRMSP